MDSRNPNVVYAAMWQAQRVPWKLTSGGPGSGLYKTTDGGAHWTKISSNPGFATGTLGKIGVSVAQSDPRVVYAIVQALDGGIFRSNDGGATWKRINAEMKLRQRAFYYTAIYADPTNPQVAYAPEVDGVYKTKDGGKTFTSIDMPHGDNHIVWINPRQPDDPARRQRRRRHRIGRRRRQLEQRAQSAHRAVLSRRARRSVSVPRLRCVAGRGRVRRPERRGRRRASAPATGTPSRSARARSSRRIRTIRTSPTAAATTARSRASTASPATRRTSARGRATWPAPRRPRRSIASAGRIRSSSHRPIRTSCSSRRKSSSPACDHGQTWKIISPDLTRNDPSTEGPTGGPIYPRSNRRRNLSRHRVARGLAARCERPLGRLRRRSRARDDRSRRRTGSSSRRRIFRSGRRSARSNRRIRRRARRISPRRATCGTTTIRTSTRRPTTARIGRR